jgi:BASS family bile acid:Na+ symporter
MPTISSLLRNRNVILPLAIVFGVIVGERGAIWTQPLVLPILALVMTLSTASITSRDLTSLKTMPRPILYSLLLNYVVMGGTMILLATWLIDDKEIWTGFIILAAVPPAVGLVPFSYLLGANTKFSLIGFIGTYLAALVLTPAIMILFLDVGFFNPVELLALLGQLIIIPLVASRILLLTGLMRRIEIWRGTVVNWSLFIVLFTIIGLNRQVFFGQFETLIRIIIIAFTVTFVLGYAIQLTAKMLHISQATGISLILIGTLKHYSLAGVIGLTLLSEKTAIPGAVCIVFAVLHMVSLGFRFKKPT